MINAEETADTWLSFPFYDNWSFSCLWSFLGICLLQGCHVSLTKSSQKWNLRVFSRNYQALEHLTFCSDTVSKNLQDKQLTESGFAVLAESSLPFPVKLKSLLTVACNTELIDPVTASAQQYYMLFILNVLPFNLHCTTLSVDDSLCHSEKKKNPWVNYSTQPGNSISTHPHIHSAHTHTQQRLQRWQTQAVCWHVLTPLRSVKMVQP